MTMAKDTRLKLIQAGKKAVLNGSFHSSGLQQILAEAGVPKGSFYHYFKSKEDFGVAIIEFSVEHQLTWMQNILCDEKMSPLKRLQFFFDSGRQWLKKNQFRQECIATKLGSELGQTSEPMRQAIKAGMTQKSKLLAECIRDGQREGEIDPEHDPAELAAFIFNGMEGVMIRMSIDRKMKPIDVFLSMLFDRVLPPR